MDVGVFGDGRITSIKGSLEEREGGVIQRWGEREGERERERITLRDFCLATEPAFLKIPSLDERSSRN